MLELARELLPLLRRGTPVAAVTVTAVARSAPRGVGATMAVTADGRVIGSISGGCVEADAISLAHLALATGTGQRGRFGFTDEAAHAAGLACGGTVEVIAFPIRADDVALDALRAVEAGRAAAVVVSVDGEDAGQLLAVTAAEERVEASLRPAWREAVLLRESRLFAGLLLLSQAPPARLIIAGAGEHAAALCRVAAAAGFAVTVCDPWHTLVTRERFPAADRLETAVPAEYLSSLDGEDLDARTAVCVLTHDERLDIPALAAALALPVGFVGAMGARSTVAHRLTLLRERGVSEVDLARLHSPLGLDLGGSSPDETAVSVLAEIIASRHDGSGRALRDIDGPVHARRTAMPEAEASPTCRTTGADTAGAPA